MLLTRDQVVNEYRNIVGEFCLGDLISIRLLEKLPPYLCRSLALRRMHIEENMQSIAFTGVNDGVIRFISVGDKAVGVYTNGPTPPVMSALPLSGHKSSQNVNFYIPYIENAISLLAEIDNTLVEFIAEWTSLIIWTERCSDYSGGLLTSSTFPNYPHCTFLSHKALRHIPPNNVLGFSSIYALAENIYHEALHQELAALLLHRDILKPYYSSTTYQRIPVPWRGSAWEPDRVFHAAYVYSYLVPLREKAVRKLTLRPCEREFLIESTGHGKTAYDYLLRQLKQNLQIFEDGCAEGIQGIVTSVSKSRIQ